MKITEHKQKPTTKGHYIKESPHRIEKEVERLEKKLDKHIKLPSIKAHHAEQKDAPLPNMRKY
jgi:hypothetical protein